METRRLKNIIIIVLLVLNLFLLALLLNFRIQNALAQQNMSDQIYALFASSDITLQEDLPLDMQPLTTLSNRRDPDSEARLAAHLLGEAASAEAQGGGIYSYNGQHGTVHFRSNGNFDYVPGNHPVDDPQALCDSFCTEFGYIVTHDELPGQSGTLTATRTAGTGLVYNCTATFRFENGVLLSASGSYVSDSNSAPESAGSLSVSDALIRFLDFRNQTGAICNAITGITPVYELRSSPSSPLQLVAKWQIVTDTYRYYVDCSTGNVIRA